MYIMKRNILFFILLFIIISSVPTLAQTGRIGAGFILGDPTGLNFAYKLTNERIITLSLGWEDNDDFHIIGDYKFYFRNVIPPQGSLSFPVYLGGGVYIFNDAHYKEHKEDEEEKKLRLGPRFVGGIGLEIQRFEVFLEIGLGMFIMPGTDTFTNTGLGFRYYF